MMSISDIFDALTASDRVCAPDGSQFGRAPDAVYPAFFANTLAFVDRLPETRCETMLELGTATGFAAIRSAPWAGHIWATDVAPRSVRFAALRASGTSPCSRATCTHRWKG